MAYLAPACDTTITPTRPSFIHQMLAYVKLIAIYVEGALYQAGLNILGTAVISGLYRKRCLSSYGNDPNVDCYNLGNTPNIEDNVQRAATYWYVYVFVAGTVPAILANLALGAFSDKYGRKINILLGVAGTILLTIGFEVEQAYPNLSIFWLCIATFLSSSLGGFQSTAVGFYAYTSDSVKDKSKLTARLVILTVTTNAGGIVGSLAIGYVGSLSQSFIALQLICEIFFVICFFWALAFLDQIPPTKSMLVLKNTTTGVFRNLMKDCWKLCTDATQTIVKKRSGNRRGYIWALFLIFFIQMQFAMGYFLILPLYTFRRPLEWSTSMLGYYSAYTNVLQLLGAIVGPLICLRLGVSDAAMVIISMLSYCSSSLITAFSTSTALIFVAGTCTCLTQMFLPASKSFLVKIIGADEVGQIFTAVGMFQSFGVIVAVVAYDFIYDATLFFDPGFVYIIFAAMAFVSTLLSAWIYIDLWRSTAKTKQDVQILHF